MTVVHQFVLSVRWLVSCPINKRRVGSPTAWKVDGGTFTRSFISRIWQRTVVFACLIKWICGL